MNACFWGILGRIQLISNGIDLDALLFVVLLVVEAVVYVCEGDVLELFYVDEFVGYLFEFIAQEALDVAEEFYFGVEVFVVEIQAFFVEFFEDGLYFVWWSRAVIGDSFSFFLEVPLFR